MHRAADGVRVLGVRRSAYDFLRSGGVVGEATSEVYRGCLLGWKSRFIDRSVRELLLLQQEVDVPGVELFRV